MHSSIIGVISIFVLSGIVLAEGALTCTDLQRRIVFRENEIERLKLTLEEYRLSRYDEEDKSDLCNRLDTCSKCAREDCGWCFHLNRCSRQENCPNSESNPDLWISGSDRCPKIRTVKPHVIAAHKDAMLDIIIPHLPEYDGIFLCSFEGFGKTLLTKGRQTAIGISCALPDKDHMLQIPQRDDHLSIKLSVRLPNSRNFVSTSNLTIYDCNHYTSCSECTASPFPCSWCVENTKCSHDVDENCKNDIIVMSKAVTRPTFRAGPNYCTRLAPDSGSEGNEILIPSGSKKRIHVKVENVMSFQVSTRFTCEVRGTGRVQGQILGDTVYCDEMLFKVLGRNPVSNLPFYVYWGGFSGIIDNKENLHVVVYHCGLMATSCSECLELPSKYDCGWCEKSNSCAVLGSCGESDGWMNRGQTCTKPVITSFYPTSGLLNRKTNITIKGINFGREFKDIERVKLINEEKGLSIECRPLEYLFVKYFQIVCELDAPKGNDRAIQGFFEVKFSNSFVAISEDKFSFVDPKISRFEPAKGIKSGGTYFKIEGHNLDAGNKVEVFVGDLPCNVFSRNSSTIHCVTSPSPRTTSSRVRVIFDGEQKMSSGYYFYVEDPYVRSVRTETGVNVPIGTLSGGNIIIVEGEYFDNVPNPYIYVGVDSVEYPGGCTMESDTLMKCSSPRLPADVLNFCGEEGFMALDYGFRMGDVQDVQNISLNEKFQKFRLYPDPFFMPFTEEGMTKTYKSGNLVIYGRYLDSVYDETHIAVYVGTKECALTALSHTQLVCRPPSEQPETRNGHGNKLPEVVVKIYDHHEFFIGFLRYSSRE